MEREKLACLGAIAVVLALVHPAWAHGEFEASTPAAGSTVAKAPRAVSVTLTEAPGPGTTIKVIDGCRKNVVASTSRSGEVLRAATDEAQPGRWKVRFRVISAVDGHTTRSGFGFTVRGKRDCSEPEPKPKKTEELAGGEDTRIDADDFPQDDEGTSFPIVPFAIGSVIVIALAVILRRATSK